MDLSICVTPHMVKNSFQERAVPICDFFVFPNGYPHMVTGIPIWKCFLYGDFYLTPHMGTNSFLEWVSDWTVPVYERVPIKVR